MRIATASNMWKDKTHTPRCLTCIFDQNLKRLQPEYKRIGSYESHKPFAVKHSCGITKDYGYDALLKGNAVCDCQHQKNWRTTESHAEEVKKLTDGRYELVGEYENTKERTRYRHVGGCGKTFLQTPSMFLGGSLCLKCETANLKWSQEASQEWLNREYGPNIYTIEGTWKSVRHEAWLRHKICGKRTKRNIESHFRIDMEPCKFCHKDGKQGKNVKIARKFFWVMGTEAKSIRYLLKRYGITPGRLKHGKQVPYFKYTFNGVEHEYRPDFWIPELNLIVESKDPTSFGFGTFYYDDTQFERNCAKAQAVISNGYRFRMLVWKDDNRLSLPPRWHDQPKEKVFSRILSKLA